MINSNFQEDIKRKQNLDRVRGHKLNLPSDVMSVVCLRDFKYRFAAATSRRCTSSGTQVWPVQYGT